MNKHLVLTGLGLVFMAFFCSAIDLSTPPDGNLAIIGSGFIPQIIEIYSDKTELEESGLKVENERIFREDNLLGISDPLIDDFHLDSNPSYASNGDMVALTGNSSRYNHGIFGKRENATGFVIVRNEQVIFQYDLEGNAVFESLHPLIVDLVPENAGEEILLTVSDATSGSKISVFSLEGRLLGSSEPIGLGYRWLHLLAVDNFGLDDIMRVALVRTPHIGGILQFYEWHRDKLVLMSSLGNLSTHQIRSDNLNMAVSGNFDGTRGAELVLPTRDFSEIVVVSYEAGEIEIINSFKLPGRLNTNIYFEREDPSSLWLGTRNGYFVNIRAY